MDIAPRQIRRPRPAAAPATTTTSTSTPPSPPNPMRIAIAHKQTPVEKIRKRYPGGCTIVDVTSKAEMPWRKLSPFWPHGGFEVPTEKGRVGESVEGVWQGLKVFTNEGPDTSRLHITDLTNLKRGRSARRGDVLGHALTFAPPASESPPLMDYVTARKRVYLPLYAQQLARVDEEVEELRRLSMEGTLVLLDFGTNGTVEDLSKPLSHAALIKAFLEDRYPACE
ncbi:uncharacterized protein EV422DRAFT_571207 [Fimicolochytrium jonesii]|uniref:uncharacterized protein n=1 Tax=Fimicolochytrium jonesii TaxID=1396493 RepID=UPI0022FE70C2|nr:uncharacterized protein EV422DRAFT_571207 [Fimicolochytrium jonesii]KAI8816906.1 hypothetical protein EV422DRAFT_571207 [Fimicolochytrium jonesii]